MKRLAVLVAVTASACQAHGHSSADLRAKDQAALDKIADKCGMPRSSWALLGNDKVTLQLGPDAPFDKGTCLIREFENSGLPLQLGFVGRESYGKSQ